MYTYRIYGLNVKSEIQLPSAMLGTEAVSEDILIIYGDIEEEYNVLKKIERTSEATMFQKLDKDCSVAYIRKIGLFRITKGKTIEYRETVNLDVYQLEQWILNFCISLAMIQRGELILHGSGIRYKDSMMVISGESGSGKSTLTNEFLKDGLKFVADDSVLVNFENSCAYGTGAYPLRRLCQDVVEIGGFAKEKLVLIPDGDKTKYGLSMVDEFDGIKVPLKYLFVLEVGQNRVKCQEVLNSDKLNCLMDCLYKKQSYKIIGFDQSMLMELLKIADDLRVFRITRPVGKMTIKEQKQFVYEIIKKKCNRE